MSEREVKSLYVASAEIRALEAEIREEEKPREITDPEIKFFEKERQKATDILYLIREKVELFEGILKYLNRMIEYTYIYIGKKLYEEEKLYKEKVASMQDLYQKYVDIHNGLAVEKGEAEKNMSDIRETLEKIKAQKKRNKLMFLKCQYQMRRLEEAKSRLMNWFKCTDIENLERANKLNKINYHDVTSVIKDLIVTIYPKDPTPIW
jgi:chromosome segregation ATPase